MIPYKNKGQVECQFQFGYKGLLELAYRSGQIQTIQAETVYEADVFEYELGLYPKLIHKPAYSAIEGNQFSSMVYLERSIMGMDLV